MEKNRLNEIYVQRLNKMINEEYGLSRQLHETIIPEYENTLRREIKKAEITIIDDTLSKKQGYFVFDFFGDGKFLLKTHWFVYYFSNEEAYNKYSRRHSFDTVYEQESRSVIVRIAYIGDKPLLNNFYDTIGHELEHVFQTALMDKNFGGQYAYNVARFGIRSPNPYDRYFAWITYASNKSEQEAFINGCYSEFINNNVSPVDFDKFMSDSEAAIWLRNLYEAYHFIKTHDDEEMRNAIRKYRKNGKRDKNKCNYQTFLRMARNGIKSFERRIARLTIAIKKPMILNASIRPDFSNYRPINECFMINEEDL